MAAAAKLYAKGRRLVERNMDFWDKQQSLSAADIAAQGKKGRYARKWRNTTFAAVDKLDASGDAAVRTAFLHMCARLVRIQVGRVC